MGLRLQQRGVRPGEGGYIYAAVLMARAFSATTPTRTALSLPAKTSRLLIWGVPCGGSRNSATAPPTRREPQRVLPYRFAAEHGDAAEIDVLVGQGAQVDAIVSKRVNGGAPLHWAAKNGHLPGCVPAEPDMNELLGSTKR